MDEVVSMSQLLIKVLIVAALAIIAARVIVPSNGSRSTALRRLLLLCFFGVAIFAVIYPQSLSAAAEFLGVGRGSDLLLYAFIVVFLGNMLTSARQRSYLERNVTKLARDEALRNVRQPEIH